MTREWTSNLKHPGTHLLLGGMGIALLTFVCFRLGLNTATAGAAYLILIVLLALRGSFMGSVALSIVAVACLNYFFAPPLFSLRVDYPHDVIAIAAFLTTSLIVTGLMTKLRTMADEAQAARSALIDTIPALVWSARPDGSRDFHNRRWLEFSGLSEAEAAGDGWAAVFHPEDRATVMEKWRLAVAAGEPLEVEARGRSARGEYRLFLIRGEPLRDDTGAIVKWYGSSIDIEDGKRATEALRASEEQWREVFEHNPVMYFMVDPTGTVLSVNGFGAAQLAYTVDELVGQSVLKVFFEEDQEAVKKEVAVCLAELGKSHSWEIRKVRKDGTLLWVRENAKAVRRADGQLVVLVACEDITERRRTEDTLRRSEAYLAEAQKLSRTGSFGWRVSTGEITWSDETFRIFDCDRATTPTLELVKERTHPDDRARVQRLLEQSSQDGRDWEFEHRLLMPSGTVRHVRVVAHAVKDASGDLEFVGAVMDITATRRAEEDLHQARTELARVTRVTTLGELTAAIAHEVNQPLTGLISSGNACLRWLADETPNIESARRAVERMVSDGTRAGEVISRIRALVRKSPERRDSLHVNEAIAEVIALIGKEIQRNRIELHTDLSHELPGIVGDRIQLQQVILNLMMNAIEAMSGKPAARTLVVASRKDVPDGVLVEVRDSGPGLDRTAIDRVFEAFYTTKPEGMGMGLAVSRTIVEAHGGQLSAASNSPEGAVFRFTLPAVVGTGVAS